MQALLWLVQGMEAKARALIATSRKTMPSAPLAAACVALAEYAIDPETARAHQQDTADRFDRLATRLPLIARIHAEILAQSHSHPGPYKAWLAEPSRTPRSSFTQLIQARQPWERALESLDAFLGADKPRPTPKAPRKAKRLAWFVDRDTQDIAAAEQSAKGRDGWTDGRPVAMKRLHEQDPRLDYLTAAGSPGAAHHPQGRRRLVGRRSLRLRQHPHRRRPGRPPRRVRRPPSRAAARTRVLPAGTAGHRTRAAATAIALSHSAG